MEVIIRVLEWGVEILVPVVLTIITIIIDSELGIIA